MKNGDVFQVVDWDDKDLQLIGLFTGYRETPLFNERCLTFRIYDWKGKYQRSVGFLPESEKTTRNGLSVKTFKKKKEEEALTLLGRPPKVIDDEGTLTW